MSAYAKVKTICKNRQSILDALDRLGFKPHMIEQGRRQLEGYHGDKRKQVADIIIPRRHVGSASNDLGFREEEDGTWSMEISEYDKTTLRQRFSGGFEAAFAKSYAVSAAKAAAVENGYEVTESVDTATSDVLLQLVKWG